LVIGEDEEMFGGAENDECRAEQSETASTAKRVLFRRSERSEAMRNDEGRMTRAVRMVCSYLGDQPSSSRSFSVRKRTSVLVSGSSNLDRF
jgi:hypothetical protein